VDLDHYTGGSIEGWSHVAQSIETLLATRVNTRVFLRDFGSDVPTLIDTPMNDANILRLYVAVAEAIEKWEPRFSLTDVQIEPAASGNITFELKGNYLPDGHLGDIAIIADSTRSIRIQTDRVDNWRLTT